MFKNVPFRRRLGVAALGLALSSGVGLAVWSASAADAQTPTNKEGKTHDPMQWREMRLEKELGLTPQQIPLAQAALAKMRPDRSMMEQMHQAHEARLMALMDPNFDPRRAAAAEDQEHAAMEAHQKEARNAWFALWDALNPEQRTKARLMLIKMADHGEHQWGGHHGAWDHGGEGMHEDRPGEHGPEGMPPHTSENHRPATDDREG